MSAQKSFQDAVRAGRRAGLSRGLAEAARARLRTVKDPELPMLDIVELGLVREVEHRHGALCVSLTPTYSGCPALDTIVAEARAALADFEPVVLRMVLSPPWTTDWIHESARRKLRACGIAPPNGTASHPRVVRCPRCETRATECVSEFGSTACKSLWRCDRCREPFELLKLI